MCFKFIAKFLRACKLEEDKIWLMESWIFFTWKSHWSCIQLLTVWGAPEMPTDPVVLLWLRCVILILNHGSNFTSWVPRKFTCTSNSIKKIFVVVQVGFYTFSDSQKTTLVIWILEKKAAGVWQPANDRHNWPACKSNLYKESKHQDDCVLFLYRLFFTLPGEDWGLWEQILITMSAWYCNMMDV